MQRAEPTRPPATAYVRWNLIVLCVAIVVLATTVLVARHELAALEVRIFRAVNELPQGLHTVVWPFMQYGTFITIPALAVVALLFRRFRLALAIVLAGVGVYLVALVVKDFVERGRPAALITAVEERELFGATAWGTLGTRRRRGCTDRRRGGPPLGAVGDRGARARGDRALRPDLRRRPPPARRHRGRRPRRDRGQRRQPGRASAGATAHRRIEPLDPIRSNRRRFGQPPATRNSGTARSGRSRRPRWPGGSDGSTV